MVLLIHYALLLLLAASGTIMGKSCKENYDFLVKMVNNNYQWQTKKSSIGRGATGLHFVDMVMALTTKLATVRDVLNFL